MPDAQEISSGTPGHPGPLVAMAEGRLPDSLACRLDDTAVITVGGEDAESFLQSQFSNDLATLEPGHCQITAYCNPKGRALAVLWLMRIPEGFLMLAPAEISDSLVKRLSLYRMRARVTFDTGSTHSAWLVAGEINEPGSDALCWAYPADNPAQDSALRLVLPSTPDALVIPGKTVELDNRGWQLVNILNGFPQVYAATQEAFIPQNINLELVDGISFRKGCYPGQEIIARLRYLGKSKRRMVIGRATSEQVPVPGDPVVNEQRPGARPGVVVDAVALEDGSHCLSLMVDADLVAGGGMRLFEASGPVVGRLPLPYDVPVEGEDG